MPFPFWRRAMPSGMWQNLQEKASVLSSKSRRSFVEYASHKIPNHTKTFVLTHKGILSEIQSQKWFFQLILRIVFLHGIKLVFVIIINLYVPIFARLTTKNAKIVNKSKKVELFCSCLTFFYYFCHRVTYLHTALRGWCRERTQRHIGSYISELAPRR